ncbi:MULTISPECIES: hypothetical protein [unclassified Moritella]|uniref:hypothetical protein n=1 Tax=unclassified Moritella TaxID=2637987 RepID=UPI001BA7D5F6|nr:MULTISPECIES: hypothetical protein [unclassified Moritella]QUM85671.1 hypothetical protein HWV02_14705 [Moritella sp. 28]QUM89890.1 hypothetical protein HWV03_14280 [Moritella sp. 36]
MLKKLLLVVTLMSGSGLTVAQLQVTSASYDKNVLAVINATDGAVEITVDGEVVQLVDSNYIMPCSPVLGFPKKVQVAVTTAAYDEEVTCPVFVTIGETE